MYETKKQVSSWTSFIDQLNLKNNGLGQNVNRYQTVPHDIYSGDVNRCKNTICSLEKKIKEAENLKKSLQECKKTCYSSSLNIMPGGSKKLHYIDEKISLIDKYTAQLKARQWRITRREKWEKSFNFWTSENPAAFGKRVDASDVGVLNNVIGRLSKIRMELLRLVKEIKQRQHINDLFDKEGLTFEKRLDAVLSWFLQSLH